MNDFPRLVLDANIMVSALLGTSFPFFEKLVEQGVELFAAEAQIAETRKILEQRPHLTSDWIERQMGRLLTAVAPLPPHMYREYESKARSRLHERAQPDWPVLAASMETASAVWSHDKDFFGCGTAVWSTRVLRGQLEMADA